MLVPLPGIEPRIPCVGSSESTGLPRKSHSGHILGGGVIQSPTGLRVETGKPSSSDFHLGVC